MSPLVNTAGSEFDFGRVTSAVLQECEHRRRGLSTNDAKSALMEIATAKLAEIRRSFDDAHGTPTYWSRLESEVTTNVMPQYIKGAVAASRREKYEQAMWGGGTILLRIFLVAIALGLAWLLTSLFLAAAANVVAVTFAVVAFFYPELTRWRHRSRHAALMARLVAEGEAYQRNSRIHYLSDVDLEEVFSPIEPRSASETAARNAAAAAKQSERQ